MVSTVPTLRKIYINKTHRSKTLHLLVEINNYIVEGLVDTGASMSVMAVVVVKELGMMHLVIGSETYKTTSRVITQALGRIDEIPVKVGGVATPLWPSVGVKPNTPKVGDLESSGTPECLRFNNKAQNTSH
jgi:hypothetical protein